MKGRLLPTLDFHSIFQQQLCCALTGSINLFLQLLRVMLQVLDVSQFLINRVFYAVVWIWVLWASSARQLNGELAGLVLQPGDELLLCGSSVVFLFSFPPLPALCPLFLYYFFRSSCLTSKARTCLRMEE